MLAQLLETPIRKYLNRHPIIVTQSMSLFDTLGFSWKRSDELALPSQSIDRALFRYKQMMPQFVFDAAALEGNPFTYPEVKTLLDGVTVGGHKLADERQVINLAQAANWLLSRVRDGTFRTNKSTFDHLHSLVANEEALEWGHFRGEGKISDVTPRVSLGTTHYTPGCFTEKGARNLKRLFEEGVIILEDTVTNPCERALAFFLFGALQQFYFDGNKRTSRFMMNGILMSNGLDAISIPAARATEFNEKMVRFYHQRHATEMMEFLVTCAPSYTN